MPLANRPVINHSVIANSTSLLLVLFCASSFGQGFVFERVADGLDSPTYVTHIPGDDSSVFITELDGAIKQLDLATGTLTTFATVDAADDWTGGLHAIAFHPDYASNGKFYTTRSLDAYGSFSNFVNRLDEFMVDGAGNVTRESCWKLSMPVDRTPRMRLTG